MGSLTIARAPEKEISKIAYVVQECVQAWYEDSRAPGATDLSDLSDASGLRKQPPASLDLSSANSARCDRDLTLRQIRRVWEQPCARSYGWSCPSRAWPGSRWESSTAESAAYAMVVTFERDFHWVCQHVDDDLQ